ncbi:hypothetical protein Hanom_Chr09g00836891 [Helianthus anomalus]
MRRHCHLETVCFSEDVLLKNVCASFSWCRLGVATFKVCRGLNTTTHHHRPPPLPSTIHPHHHRPPPTTIVNHQRPTPPPSTTTVRTPPPVYLRSLHTVKKQTTFFLQTVEIWSTSSSTDIYRCGLQTADILPLKKQITTK